MTGRATSFHVYSGWAFPRETLAPLAGLLRSHAHVALHDALDPLPEDVENAILVGWSLGGLRLLDAVCRGATPAALILIAGTARYCACEGYPHGVPESALRSMIVGLTRNRLRTLAAFLQMTAESDAAATTFVDQHLADASGLEVEPLRQGLALLRDLDLRDRVRDCAAPTLLLHGTDDRIIPIAAADWLHRHLPTSLLIAKPEAGHDLPLRHPDWVADQVGEFLRTLG